MTSTTPSSRRRGLHRSSIGDVARQAGVSLGTVSNVLNRPERVAAGPAGGDPKHVELQPELIVRASSGAPG